MEKEKHDTWEEIGMIYLDIFKKSLKSHFKEFGI